MRSTPSPPSCWQIIYQIQPPSAVETTPTCRSDDPMRKIDISSSRAPKTRVSPRYVPFVDRRSVKKMASRLTSTEQCKRDTSGSSISMSAPPPNRPIVMRGRDRSHLIPCDGPLITARLIVLSRGSIRLAVSESTEPLSLESPDFACGTDTCIAIVCGAGSLGGKSTPKGRVHIQHVT